MLVGEFEIQCVGADEVMCRAVERLVARPDGFFSAYGVVIVALGVPQWSLGVALQRRFSSICEDGLQIAISMCIRKLGHNRGTPVGTW